MEQPAQGRRTVLDSSFSRFRIPPACRGGGGRTAHVGPARTGLDPLCSRKKKPGAWPGLGSTDDCGWPQAIILVAELTCRPPDGFGVRRFEDADHTSRIGSHVAHDVSHAV